MHYLNQLEPESLVGEFFNHPPRNFNAWKTASAIPVFSAEFDLLTTLDDSLRKKIMRMPLYRYWGKWLKPYTCFVGTTVSEYALLPDFPAENCIAELKRELAKRFAFLIIKDIPQSSPLLDENSNRQAKALLLEAKAAGFVAVEGQALAWVPIDFSSVDNYLERLSKSRRKNIRRKLQAKASLSIEILATGDAFFTDANILNELYTLYLNVFNQSEIHFDLLTQNFFTAILQNSQNGGVVFIYRDAGTIIGYNICFVVGTHLVDKYIGLSYPAAREKNLYFISWFVNLQYALEKNLTHYIAGWTDPEVKKSLGAKFTFTSHAVHVRNPVLRLVLKPFTSLFERDANALKKIASDALDDVHG